MKTLNQMMKKKSEKIGFSNNQKIDMIGAREKNLGSTRSQTLEMRSPSTQAMERANINMDNWIKETCYISVVTSGPDAPSSFDEA